MEIEKIKEGVKKFKVAPAQIGKIIIKEEEKQEKIRNTDIKKTKKIEKYAED